MPQEFIDLDELEELNPQDRIFKVAGRDGVKRDLILREIPHADFYRALAVAGAIQDMAMTGEYAVGQVERTNIRLLMDLYGQANPWLAEFDEQTWHADHEKWFGEPAAENRGPEPKRAGYAGSFFGELTGRKNAYLSTEALKLGTSMFEEEGALPNVPPELAAAMAAARNRGKLAEANGKMKPGSGRGHTRR